MIVATPLDLPKVEPDNWDLFWDLWDSNAGPLTKRFINTGSELPVDGAPNLWRGLDIFDTNSQQSAWTCPYIDASSLFPKMFELLKNTFPKLYRVRLIESTCNIPAHSDDSSDRWNVRALFHYTSNVSQWYFTKPNNVSERVYLQMPETTNWFGYNDKYCWHGSDYDAEHPKILLQVYSMFTPFDLIQRSKEKYTDYALIV